MAALIPLLLLIPIVGAVLGYAKWGVMGAVFGGAGGLIGAVALGGWPFMVLLRTEHRNQDAKEAEWSRWMAARSRKREAEPKQREPRSD